MRPTRPPLTVDSVKTGCARLAQQIASLEKEVQGLSEKLARFKRGRVIPDEHAVEMRFWFMVDRLRGERVSTPEPGSAVLDLEKDLSETEVGIAALVLLAIGKDLDGCVREVRAAKATLQAIADDSDLRAEFKDWQQRQK